jgi:simple sugar transport system substrate-binding protein
MAALRIAEYFADHPETNAIFMLGPQPASALNIYVKQAGLKPRQLYATTHDTSLEIFQMIQDGYLLQTIDQQPYMQGFQTIMSLYLYRQYGLRPSGFINTSSVIDRSNVDVVAQLVEAGYR